MTMTIPYSSTRCRLHCRASLSETPRTARRERAPSGAQPLASCRICAALRKGGNQREPQPRTRVQLTQHPNTCAAPAWRRCMHLGSTQVRSGCELCKLTETRPAAMQLHAHPTKRATVLVVWHVCSAATKSSQFEWRFGS
jgi:hypothetical protein